MATSAAVNFGNGQIVAGSIDTVAAIIGVFSDAGVAKVSMMAGYNAAMFGLFKFSSARGVASEARVLGELGLAKNTTAVKTAEGRAIPDALTKSSSVEVKDTAQVSLTQQLRIQTGAATASGRESVLITGEKTCISGPCRDAFDRIIRRSDLGPR
jgi:hypothetical protein